MKNTNNESIKKINNETIIATLEKRLKPNRTANLKDGKLFISNQKGIEEL